MRIAPRVSSIRSANLSRYPDLVHGVLVGPRIYPRKGVPGTQPAAEFVERVVGREGMARPSVALNVLTHSPRVFQVDPRHAPVRYGDGLVTLSRGMVLAMTVADCVPVFAYDPDRKIIGLAHAGRRGIVRGIIPSLIEKMEAADASSRRIRVWLGPSARSCCYSFDHDRHERFYGDFARLFGPSSVQRRGARVHLDLHRAIVGQLGGQGVSRGHIEIDPTCSIHTKRLPSHSREGRERTKTMWAYIGLKDPVDNLRGARVLVMGLGLHGGGVDTARWLIKQGAKVTVTDLKDRAALRPSLNALRGVPVRYVLGAHRRRDIDASELLAVSPGVPRTSPYLLYAEKKGIPIETDSSIFMHRCTAPVVGITGTKGKTTTSVLTASMLKNSGKHVVAVGHFEVPMLSFLSKLRKDSTVVAELSSWRLERLTQRRQSPHIAVITNNTPDHLNRYKGFNEYVKAKELIVEYQHPSDHAILNRDDVVVRKIGRGASSKRWWFSLHRFSNEEGAFIERGTVVVREAGKERVLDVIPHDRDLGDHQLRNILAAILAARCAGATVGGIKKAIRAMKPIPHRFEPVGKVGGVQYINDSAATTPDAALASLAMVRGPVVLLAGGADKRLSYASFTRSIERRAKFLVLFAGAATDKIISHLSSRAHYAIVRNMREALTVARSVAVSGDTVLLSPGAASFGLFLHEFDRGDQFRKMSRSIR